jgi:hypothetical protein
MSDTKPNYLRSLVEWQQQVAGDQSLPPNALHVATILTKFVNTRSFEAWPGRETIATALGISVRTVIRTVNALVARGHLKVVAGGGRGISNHYRPILKKANASSRFSETSNPPSRGGNGDTAVTLSEPETVTPVTGNGDKRRPKTVTRLSPELIEDSIEELIDPFSAPSVPEKGRGLDHKPADGAGLGAPPSVFNEERKKAVERESAGQAFKKFWQHYPKREGEDGARREFTRLINEGIDPKEIIAGAMRYAAERTGEPERFTRSATNWLRDGRWKDPPKQRKGNGADQAANRPRRSSNAKNDQMNQLAAMVEELKRQGH